LSISSALALAVSMPVYADECEGVLVQSRFALANCLVESAVAIAAAAAAENDCQAGPWNIQVDIPETNFRLIPLQGTAYITGDGDDVELSGQSSALAANNVNCRIETTESDNLFDGKDLVYASGFNNFYEAAIIDRDLYELCIKDAVSSADIALGDDDFDESNNLTFAEEDDAIVAEGKIYIGESQGGQGQGQGEGQGPGGPDDSEDDDLDIWEVKERVVMPEVGGTGSFDMGAVSDDFNERCTITVGGDIVDTASPLNPAVSTSLQIIGTLSVTVGGEDEDDD
jgi:hypothetical protein